MVLREKVIQSFACLEVVLAVDIQVVVINRKFHIRLDALLLVPRLDLVFVEASLRHFFVRHQVENGIDLAVLGHLGDVDLVERVATNHDVVLSSWLDDLVEEETVKEGSICLLDISINDLDFVFDFVMAG